jgi:hypothetical protein
MATRCPKCGFENLPEASECPVCGVVFAKLERAPQGPQAAEAAAPPRQPVPPPLSVKPALDPPPAAYQKGAAADVDPYAAPRSTRIVGGPAFPGFGEPQGGCWRSERLLVMELGAELPARCVRCNAPANERVTKTMYWHNPWLYLLLVAWPVYLVTAVVVRKRARIAAPLCPLHLSRRRARITGSWTVVLIVAVAMEWARGPDLASISQVGVVALPAGLAAAVFAHRLLAAKRIDDSHVWLKGAGPEFLNSIPSGPSLM